MILKNESYDIIIQAGQSNAEGAGQGEVENEYLPCDKVLYLTSAKQVEHTPERVVVSYADEPFHFEIAQEEEKENKKIANFSLSFAKKYIDEKKLQEGRKLLIIRAAIGGTGFKKGDWGIEDLIYQKMIEMTNYALSLNSENRIVAFLWHQGEHDAFEGNTPEKFYEQLFGLVQDLRHHYGNVPFIAGDFVNDWKSKNMEISEPIINMIKAVVKNCGNAGFVETSDLLSNNQKLGNGDEVHFCREALYVLGERYFECYKKIVGLI